jgi:Zn finger protein HypA/HybF involved in hydrogenase expression
MSSSTTMTSTVSKKHISNVRKTTYAEALDNIPSATTRSIPCKACNRYFLILNKTNGDIVECPECHAKHRVVQKITIKTSVEIIA